MKTLILGASGQLGQALQSVFRDHELLLPTHHELDLSQPQVRSAIIELAPDLVLLPAAYTNVDGCTLDPERALRENTLGPKYVALACAALDIPLVYISTNEVFDGCATLPYHEYDQPAPINQYGRSKWGGEQVVLRYASQALVVRVAWLFGGPRNFIRTILRLAQERGATGVPLQVVDDEIGSPTYAPDAAQAIRQLVAAGLPGIYHIVNQGYCSRFELARATLQLANSPVGVEPIKLADFKRPSTPPPWTPLANGAAAALGITLRSWEVALSEFVGIVGEAQRGSHD